MSQSQSHVVSVDVPWGNGKYVGVAVAVLADCRLQAVRATSVRRRRVGDVPDFPADEPEVAGFVADGAGAGRATPEDADGPFNSYPHTPAARRRYLEEIWDALLRARRDLELERVSCEAVLTDMPIVPGNVVAAIGQRTNAGTYRPVENAFGNKVWVPGANPNRPADGLVQFARFQAGVINGCRPGYAVSRLAMIAFGAPTGGESFPQLEIGTLAEFGARSGLPLPAKLAAHKTGSAATRQAGQDVLWPLICSWLGVTPTWTPADPGDAARPDGYDALLGLLPLVAMHWARQDRAGAVLLRNLHPGQAPVPTTARSRCQPISGPAAGCGPWKGTANLPPGINDQGLVTLDLSLWGV